MAAAALLEKKPKPTDADIDAAMTNICRCGTYQRVRAAIKRAGAAPAAECTAPGARMKRRALLLAGLGATGALVVGWSVLPAAQPPGAPRTMLRTEGDVALNGWIKIAPTAASSWPCRAAKWARACTPRWPCWWPRSWMCRCPGCASSRPGRRHLRQRGHAFCRQPAVPSAGVRGGGKSPSRCGRANGWWARSRANWASTPPGARPAWRMPGSGAPGGRHGARFPAGCGIAQWKAAGGRDVGGNGVISTPRANQAPLWRLCGCCGHHPTRHGALKARKDWKLIGSPAAAGHARQDQRHGAVRP
jgi:hypothetical protein